MIGPLPLRLGTAVLLGMALAAAASAEPRTPDEVVGLVTRAAAHIQVIGAPAAFADFSCRDGGFVDGELYVFCNTAEGVVLAHGGNPKLVGRNLATVRDLLGNQPVAEVDRIALAHGQGWHDYVWPNPATGLIQRKKSYVVRIDDNTVCGSGYYQPGPP
ncbi:MAG: cache domain-containing protein [Rhodopila sp.]